MILEMITKHDAWATVHLLMSYRIQAKSAMILSCNCSYFACMVNDSLVKQCTQFIQLSQKFSAKANSFRWGNPFITIPVAFGMSLDFCLNTFLELTLKNGLSGGSSKDWCFMLMRWAHTLIRSPENLPSCFSVYLQSLLLPLIYE